MKIVHGGAGLPCGRPVVQRIRGWVRQSSALNQNYIWRIEEQVLNGLSQRGRPLKAVTPLFQCKPDLL